MTKYKKTNFPYIKKIQVNECFTCQDIVIDINNENELSHLILTGKNGSGKTTILEGLASVVKQEYTKGESKSSRINYLTAVVHSNQNHPERKIWDNEIEHLSRVDITPNIYPSGGHPFDARNVVFSYFRANRKIELADVTTITKEDTVINKVNDDNFSLLFKQFLVNKKVYQAFSMLDGNSSEIHEHQKFFDLFEGILRRIFDDKSLKLSFVREEFEFYINMKGVEKKINFNQLSSGFSSYLNIIMDLMIRVDVVRRSIGDIMYDPCGVVLIDEPENHMHIQMQYEVLPLLTELFPNLQFIVATHSPAVISSIKNVKIYDLSSGRELDDIAVGSSYSELMVAHFNVDNEYSNIADSIIDDAKNIINIKDKRLALIELKELIRNNSKYISPILRLDLESYVLKLERESL